MEINRETGFFNHIDHLMEQVHKCTSSQQTIDFLIRWMVETYQLCGSAFVRIQSGKGLGAEWLSFYPENLFSSKLYEIDFNDQALIYQRQSKPFIIDRNGLLSINELTRDWAIRHNIYSAVLIPIQYKMDIESLLLLYRGEEQPQFSQQELEDTALVTRMVANVLKWQINSEGMEQYARELDQMLRASLSMTESLNLNDVLNAILDNALELIPDVNDAHIFLYENYVLNFGAAKFCNGTTGTVWAEPREDGLTYRVARTGITIRVDDMSERFAFSEYTKLARKHYRNPFN